MANIISRLGVLLGLDSAEFVKGLDAANRKLDQFEQKINAAGKIATAGFVAMGARALVLADEIADVAQANDLAISSVLKLSDALLTSGGKAEDAGKVLASFTNYIDKAAGGSFEAQQKLAKLGISLKDIGTLDSQQLLNKTLQGLSAIEDPIQRNAAAFDIFGKAFKGVDVKGFNDSISKTNDLTDSQAKAVQDAADAYDVLKQNARETQLIFAQSLGPVLLETINYFKQTEGSSISLGKVLTTTFQAIAVIASDLGFTFKTILADVQAVFQAINAGIKGDFAEAGRIMGAAVNRAKADRAALDAYQNRILGLGEGTGGGSSSGGASGGGTGGGGRPVTPGVDTKGEAERREMQRRLQAIAVERIKNEFAAEKASASEIGQIHLDAAEQLATAREKIARDNAANNNKYAAQNAELLAQEEIGIEERKQARLRQLRGRYAAQEAQQRQEMQDEFDRAHSEEQARKDQAFKSFSDMQQAEMRSLEFDQKRVQLKDSMRFATDQEYRTALARIDVEERIARIVSDTTIAEDRKQALIAEAQSVGKLREGLIAAESAIDRVGQSWDSVFNNMTNAIDSFVRTGKLSFKDLARSIMADLISIEMQAQSRFLFGLFKKAFTGGAGDGAEGLEFLRSYESGGKASGGTITAGSPTLVGERGPELFIPRTSGMVVPNNNLSDVMGGGGQVINNYNISAIDVKSFEERILGSSRAIWAANAYANKSLAVAQGRA